MKKCIVCLTLLTYVVAFSSCAESQVETYISKTCEQTAQSTTSASTVTEISEIVEFVTETPFSEDILPTKPALLAHESYEALLNQEITYDDLLNIQLVRDDIAAFSEFVLQYPLTWDDLTIRTADEPEMERYPYSVVVSKPNDAGWNYMFQIEISSAEGGIYLYNGPVRLFYGDYSFPCDFYNINSELPALHNDRLKESVNAALTAENMTIRQIQYSELSVENDIITVSVDTDTDSVILKFRIIRSDGHERYVLIVN